MIGRRKVIGWGVLGLVSAFTLSSLGSSQSQKSTVLVISAAASLQDVLQEIGDIYRQHTPHIQLTYNFGASGSLRYQIEQGAPVDIYISAAQRYMDALQSQDLLLPGTRKDLLKNEMVLITAKRNTDISGFTQLKSDRVQKIAIGAPESVPAGAYAKEVLDTLHLYQALESKFVFAKDVRQVLTYVETGNVDAGMVYRTDAKISDRVKIIEIAPDDSHSPIVYPVAIIRESKNPEAAQEFVQFLFSPPAQKIFQKYGFMNRG
ncbi:molybdate ABC transporter substrate-binding protein [Roseofilum capinflatum]|uniref:Molybdate ABC transporter substrate-binding protein n=1 Tax=Roseofilum capinflatum BLCC-M114 TaxID=3022440 RepID=A0ABT7BBP7_9CYAN|nr:molybdate ABC transporter substrate-binding protein [Roseofilum capinflatum]MDJ1175718.1 molybdate ABC transporter substrate-binding protein [Roseofilum capinflatum BLCC-M114]